MSRELSKEDKKKLADLGALIRKIRIAKKFSVCRLAAVCEIGEGTVRDFEKGRRNLELATLFKICEELEVEVAYVFGMRNDESKKTVKAMNREITRGIDPYFTLRERAERFSPKSVDPDEL